MVSGTLRLPDNGGLLSLTHDGSHGLGKGHLIGPRCQLLDVSKSKGGLSIDADSGLGHDLRGVGGAQVDILVGTAVIAQAHLDRFGGLSVLTSLTLCNSVVSASLVVVGVITRCVVVSNGG